MTLFPRIKLFLYVKISTLGGTKNESGQSVVATSDGGFAVLGYSQSMDGDILNKVISLMTFG